MRNYAVGVGEAMISLPPAIEEALAGSDQAPCVQVLNRYVEQILVDNKTPFFPDYTDHGTDHIERVLSASARLIPKGIWSKGKLSARDFAVLCGAIVLHDIGLHLHEAGFRELVSAGTDYQPLPWFDTARAGRAGDVEWPQLWRDFRSEARHFTNSQLDVLLGPGHDGVPSIAYGDNDQDPDAWDKRDRRLVGEFLRRHHGRLAHEIAMYGFPGARDTFPPVCVDDVPRDAIGVVARSHAEDLRTIAVDYLGWLAPTNRRPHDLWLPYLMGLLRVADYLQIEAKRAPSLLFRLRRPQARASIDAWNKHQAVDSISWEGDTDRQALYVHVSEAHGLRTHLQLRELLTDLQSELDTTSAVLRELYPGEGIKLAKQRVRSNLLEPSLHERLPFVPRAARLHSGDDLFRLLVHNLYGDNPAVGGRELLQNAVDAVRQRRQWEASANQRVEPSLLRDQSADVVVTLAEADEGMDVLRISDRGLGMTPDVVIDYFLGAGASFGPSAEIFERLGQRNATRWMRAGRFGIGAFAAFLIGPELRVATRHVDDDRGVTFRTRLDADLIELRWESVPVGTQVEIMFNLDDLPRVGSHVRTRGMARSERFLREIANFYVLQEPTVEFEVETTQHESRRLSTSGFVPTPGTATDYSWREASQDHVDAVLWTDGKPGLERALQVGSALSNIAHNGLEVRPPTSPAATELHGYSWRSPELLQTLTEPYVAVFDSQHRLGLSLTRYELHSKELPFEDDLARSIGLDVLAHALVVGARQHPCGRSEAPGQGTGYGLRPVIGSDGWFPFSVGFCDLYIPTGATITVIWYERLNQASESAARAKAQAAVDRAAGPSFCIALPTSSGGEGLVADMLNARRLKTSYGTPSAGSNSARPAAADWPHRRTEVPELTTFEKTPSTPGAPLAPLVAPWHELVGAALTNDRHERDTTTAEIARPI